MEYPKREPFFAMRFLRLLTKSAAAMEIGPEGMTLLLVIVGQEDACRYSRPVNFWNAQLATLCGIPANNETQLRRVRDRCVKAGWLQYESGGRRKHGRYYAAIPSHIDQDNDGGCDESPLQSVRQSDANPTPDVPNVCADCAQSVRNVCAECAPSIPSPLPSPIPKDNSALEVRRLFCHFWDDYGKKTKRSEAWSYWKKMSTEDQDAAVDGVLGFVAAHPDPKYRPDPIRYLRHRRWEDEASPAGQVCPHPPGTDAWLNWHAKHSDSVLER